MRTRLTLTLVAAMILVSGMAHGQSIDMRSAPLVKRGLELWKGRSEISLQFGSTIEDPYFRNLQLHLGYDYYLLNWLSLGGNLGYSLPMKTRLTEEIERDRSVAGNSFAIPATYFGAMAEIHANLLPIYGKTLWINSVATAFDYHFTLGVAGIQVLWNKDAAGQFQGQDEFVVAPVLGVGIRLFINQRLAISIDVKDYIANMNIHGAYDYTIPEKEWVNNVVFNLGFSLFLPLEAEYENE